MKKHTPGRKETIDLFATMILGLGAVSLSFGLLSGLWEDEGYTYLVAQYCLSDMLGILQDLNITHPPLWYLINKAVLGIFTSELWVIRLPSYCATVASSILLYQWGRELSQPRAGMMAACLFLCSPMTHYYAHEGRSYALQGFLYLTAGYFLFRTLRSFSFRRALGSALCLSILVYLHNYGLVLFAAVVGLGAMLFLLRHDFRTARNWLLVHTIPILLYVPWIGFLAKDLGQVGESRSLSLAWGNHTWFSAFFCSLRNLVPGSGYSKQSVSIASIGSGGVFLFLLGIALLALGTKRIGHKSREQASIYAGMMLFPLLFIALYSNFISPVFVLGRTESIVLPIFIFWLGVSINSISKPRAAVILCGIFVCSGLYGLAQYYLSPTYPRKQWDQKVVDAIVEEPASEVLILDSSISTAIPSDLDRRPSRPFTIFLYPDSTLSTDWRARFLPLHTTPDLKNAEVALAKLHSYFLENPNITKVTVIGASLGKRTGEWKYELPIPDLYQMLKEIGFSESKDRPPFAAPKDRTSAYHVGINFTRAHFPSPSTR